VARRQLWRYGFVIQQPPYGEWSDVEDLRRDARAIIARHERQTAEDVAVLRARYEHPILGDVAPVHTYKPGSWGPIDAERLTAEVGGWHTPIE